MLEQKEAKHFIVETCINVIETLSKDHSINELRIRVDLETLKSKPVFGLFDNSVFKKQCSLKEIIHAGGGKGFSMILGIYIKNILRDIFSQTMKRLEIIDPKQMFVLLYLKKHENVTIPMISLYTKKGCFETIPIADAIEVSDKPM